MNTTTQNAADHASIKQTLKHWNQAVIDKNLPRIREHYCGDVVAFDAVGQLQFKGRDAYMAHWQAGMAAWALPCSMGSSRISSWGRIWASVIFCATAGGPTSRGKCSLHGCASASAIASRAITG